MRPYYYIVACTFCLALALVAALLLRNSVRSIYPEHATTNQLNASTLSPYDILTGTYTIVPEHSTLTATLGQPLHPEQTRSATITGARGSITLAQDARTSTGMLTFDTAHISTTPTTHPEEDAAWQTRITGPGWLNVTDNPTATLTITSIATTTGSPNHATLNGLLTIRGITREITIPATIYMQDAHTLMVRGTYVLLRTDWDMTESSVAYLGPSNESALDDTVTIEFDIMARTDN